jgi:hypothetical protein
VRSRCEDARRGTTAGGDEGSLTARLVVFVFVFGVCLVCEMEKNARPFRGARNYRQVNYIGTEGVVFFVNYQILSFIC